MIKLRRQEEPGLGAASSMPSIFFWASQEIQGPTRSLRRPPGQPSLLSKDAFFGGKEDSSRTLYQARIPDCLGDPKKMEGTLLLGGSNRVTRRGASPLRIIPRKTEKFSFFSENAKKPPPFEPQGQKS